MDIKPTSNYKAIPPEEALRLLAASAGGLTEQQASERLKEFGHNEVLEKKQSPALAFLSRYWGPMPWLLELTILLSYAIQHYLEAIIVFALLTINATIGFFHTRSSRHALELLKNRLAVKARVLRDGKWMTEDARRIVPGDIIAVGLGDLVPADAKVISGELSVDQSALTGESLPVSVRESGIIYSSAVVRRGEARALVLNTGVKTYFGKTAELVRIAKPKSHQEQVMMSIVKYMMYVSMAALALVAAEAALTQATLLTILTFSLIFLMGAVPVALPAVFAVVLSIGAIELTRKGALVTRLDSIEDAASMQVLCLDKTGTITQNKLAVTEPRAFHGFTEEDVVLMAALASKDETKDAIDTTIIDHAKSLGVQTRAFRQLSFTPFEPATKRSEAVIQSNGIRFKVVKGAPQVILDMCENSDVTRSDAEKTVLELSQKGYRVLAVAKSENDELDRLRLVGLIPLADPPRPDSKEMIQELRILGVKPKMLTGDSLAIAQEIARRVSIGDKIYRVPNFVGLTEVEQAKIVDEYDGFAEIYPEDKYRIVKLLQSYGQMVGMTGDGVNDSPALKQAEVGIAVKDSTDVAKASASIVLTEPGTRVIIDAIRVSRQIYQRMLTWVVNKVTKVIQFVGLLTLGFFWLHGIVLSVLGMVLLVFANDFVTMSLATDNAEHTSNPNVWNIKNITLASLIIGALLVLEGAISVVIGLDYFNLNWGQLQTFVMLMLIFTSQVRVICVRERKHFWSSRPGRELVISTTLATLAFIVVGIYGFVMPALTALEVLVCLAFSVAFTLAIDVPKYYAFRMFGL
jgi:H+-transporting ATPase